MRAFISIELPAEACDHLLRVQSTCTAVVGDDAKPTPAPSLHLTLKFLGEVSPDLLPELIDSLAKIRRSAPVLLQAQDLECLPQRDEIRILGAAMGGDAAALRGLQRAVEQRCQHLGFTAERRSFRPHVTLARAKAGLPRALEPSLLTATQPLWPGPSFLAHSFQLMKSELHAAGAQYTALHQFSFADPL